MRGSALDLAPSRALFYQGPWRSKPEQVIYRLDQAFAQAGIDYFATMVSFGDAPSFTVHVRVRDRERARAIIERIRSRTA